MPNLFFPLLRIQDLFPFTPLQPPTIASIFKRLFGSFATATPAAMDAAETRVTALINENPVMVFSKSYCPYCISAKKLLKDLDAQCEIIELDKDGQYLFFVQSMDVSN